jgi:secretion system chaperone SscA
MTGGNGEGKLKDVVESQDDSRPRLSMEKIEELHHIAFQLYQDGQYENAIHFFRLLTLVDPLEIKYRKGLAASLQMNKNYAEAIENYRDAQSLNPDTMDPYLYLHAADCRLAVGQIEEGLKALEGAEIGAQREENVRVLNHISLMRELWSKKQEVK